MQRLTLTKEELQEISGYKQIKKIKEWLYSKGINFITDARNVPKVSREVVYQMLKGEVSLKEPQRKRGNADALREALGIH
jgi:hypothetical protein